MDDGNKGLATREEVFNFRETLHEEIVWNGKVYDYGDFHVGDGYRQCLIQSEVTDLQAARFLYRETDYNGGPFVFNQYHGKRLFLTHVIDSYLSPEYPKRPPYMRKIYGDEYPSTISYTDKKTGIKHHCLGAYEIPGRGHVVLGKEKK